MKTEKITFRVDKDLLKEIDSYIDFEKFKNRTDIIYHFLNKSMDRERTAVILDKGNDKTSKNFDNQIKIKGTNEYRITAHLKDTYLITEQLKQLYKYNFNKVYIITTKNAIAQIKNILKDNKFNMEIKYIENKNLKSVDALSLIKKEIKEKFLLIFGDIFFNFDIDEFYSNSKKVERDSINILIYTMSSPEIKGNVWMEGNKIIKHDEKPKVNQTFLVSAGMYLMYPNIFNYKGSLPYEVIPKFLKEKKLFGFTTSGEIMHIHNKEDKKQVIKSLKGK